MNKKPDTQIIIKHHFLAPSHAPQEMTLKNFLLICKYTFSAFKHIPGNVVSPINSETRVSGKWSYRFAEKPPCSYLASSLLRTQYFKSCYSFLPLLESRLQGRLNSICGVSTNVLSKLASTWLLVRVICIRHSLHFEPRIMSAIENLAGCFLH